jgi:hypothetical protein
MTVTNKREEIYTKKFEKAKKIYERKEKKNIEKQKGFKHLYMRVRYLDK